MPVTSHDILQRYFQRMKENEWTLNNINKAYKKGVLVRRDLCLAYEGLFLQSVVAFELLIEDLFLHLITGLSTHPRPTGPLHKFPSIDVARDIITQKRYIDWLPIGKMEDISKVFFLSGQNPFLCLTGPQKTEIDKVLIIRNYIAHKSEFSKNKFIANVVGTTVLPSSRNVLLTYFQFPHSGTVTKYGYHVGVMVQSARTLCL
jgi:hypothetical protein